MYVINQNPIHKIIRRAEHVTEIIEVPAAEQFMTLLEKTSTFKYFSYQIVRFRGNGKTGPTPPPQGKKCIM